MAALTIQTPAMAISDDERSFFAGLGEREVQLRKARCITQFQLAKALGVSQQTVQAYEVGQRRTPVSTLRLLPKPKQRPVMHVIEALLAKQGR